MLVITNTEERDGESPRPGTDYRTCLRGPMGSYRKGSDGLIWEGITEKRVFELSPGNWAGFE